MNTPQPEERISCTINMRFSDEKRAQEAVQVLGSSVGCTRSKMGCLACRVSVHPSNPRALTYMEEWEMDVMFRKHVRSDDFRSVFCAMDMCCAEPQVLVGTFLGHVGIDYLKTLHNEEVVNQ